jgi:hypothetical protein
MCMRLPAQLLPPSPTHNPPNQSKPHPRPPPPPPTQPQRSANIYETSTEALFFGRQDAMQRSALQAMSDWLRETGR